MKKLYINYLINAFFLIFISLIGYSQPKKPEDIKEFVWGENDTYTEIPAIPEKWKNESAVVILKNESHYYNKSLKTLNNFFVIRKIIKLNDKASLEKFSEFNYASALLYNNKFINNWLGIKIIKPNGDIKIIDVENEKIETSFNENTYFYGYSATTKTRHEIYKLAVPELEIGDIIDYYIYTREKYSTRGFYVMRAFENVISEEYPIMNFNLNLKVENDFFINFNTFNGATKLEDITPPKQRDKEYLLAAKNIEKINNLQWIYPLVEYPSYKYQISFAQTGKYENRTPAFLSKKEDIIKTKIDSEEILKKYKNSYNLKYITKDIKKFFKNKELSKKQLVEEAYYYMRHVYLNQYMEGVIADEENLISIYTPSLYKKDIAVTTQGRFLVRFGSFLKKNNIPFEIIKAKYRYDGNIDGLLLQQNLISAIKVNLEEPIYLYPFNNNTFFNWIPSTIEGTDVYLMSFNKNYEKIEKVKKSKLPISNYKDNNTKEVSNISFDDNFSQINLKRESFHKGHNKVNQINSRLFFFDYINTEYKKYGTTAFADLLKKKDRKKYDQTFAAYKEKISKNRLEKLEKNTQDEFDFKIDEYTYEITNTGRNSIDDYLSYSEKYIVKEDLLKKAGVNYILEIGKLIGNQVAIGDKDKQREENIYMSYPRSFNNEITVTIPNGYTVSGYDKLNEKIENETGGFVSEASLSGQILTVKTYKYYKNNYEPNANWSKMLAFLEMAYQFSQKKILLKKI